ncbi:nuclear assembly factor NAF1 [Fusarium globosum]|uniref:H/ACA ribonucleoprotein complex non-core subunit NAF1 n=1 Tax=Fusarium globosum TaxID=78864 RepID=A0A8H6D1U2_9HYPO|nr:nuclear assembly factor NAF1 [Fusarium globosum]
MSGFQIPGLGQAKPNETLPPMPADVLAAAASVQDTEITDAVPNNPKDQPSASAATEAKPSEAEPAPVADSDAMAVDQPESPPSLTGALEAAIGGLNPTQAAQSAPTENTETVPLQNDQGDNPEWEVDSSPYESSSESSSSASSDEDSDDNEGYELLGVEETARLLMQAEGGSDDEGDRGATGSRTTQVRTKNEIPEEVIPKPDVTITPEMKMEELGAIEHIVENMMLIKAFTPGEYQVLDSGSVLCTAERVVIGAIADTIGKVLQPMYTVRFTSDQDIKDLGLEVGQTVYYPTDHAAYVFTEPLKNMKGSDASNLHDEEVGDDEMEFSDDEKEAEYKRAIKQKKKDKWKKDPSRGSKEPHPLRQESRPDGGLNYDDDDDGPYKPLARPPGYGSGPSTTETYEPPSSRNFHQRGGRRGDSRGRGGRGRGSGRGGRGGFNQPRDGYSLPPQASPQQAQQAAPPAPWAAAQPPAQGTAPAMPNFGFQIPGWPQPPAQGNAAAAPPPPPGWPAAQGQQQAANGGSFVNPAFFAALMSSMQAQQNGQSPWGQQQQPPNSGNGQGQ